MVTGHSLGGIIAQVFMDKFRADIFQAITFGSPGAPTSKTSDPRILHVEHSQDAVALIGDDNLAQLASFHKPGERIIIPKTT